MGSAEPEARDVADHLVAANLSGHDSHGIGMLPDYVRMLHAGLLVPNQTLGLIADNGGVLVFDAGQGFGKPWRSRLWRTDRTGEGARLRRGRPGSSHIGRIGHWAEQCAAAGMVSVHFVNVADHEPLQAPMAAATPASAPTPSPSMPRTGPEPQLLLDMATSAIAFGKARPQQGRARAGRR